MKDKSKKSTYSTTFGVDPKKAQFPLGLPLLKKEAWVGIEPTMKLLQSLALPLGYHAEI